jgi:hypothetical protein
MLFTPSLYCWNAAFVVEKSDPSNEYPGALPSACNVDSCVANGFTDGVVPLPYEYGEPAVVNLSKSPIVYVFVINIVIIEFND